MSETVSKPVPLIPLNEQERSFLGNAIDFFSERYGHLWQQDTHDTAKRLLATMTRKDY